MSATVFAAFDPSDTSVWVVACTFGDYATDIQKIRANIEHQCFPTRVLRHSKLGDRLRQLEFVVLEEHARFIPPADMKDLVYAWSKRTAEVQAAINARFPPKPVAIPTVPRTLTVTPPPSTPVPEIPFVPETKGARRATLPSERIAALLVRSLGAADIVALITQCLCENAGLTWPAIRDALVEAGYPMDDSSENATPEIIQKLRLVN